ncbi:hypothetical protein L208DRAFT_1379202 [Tricholoma matsutake]|nr:hypothetical protein L208DRAFT_1379202 [Tricholoma matsutake 945]
MPRFIIVNDGTIRESREYEDPRPRKRQRVLFEQDDDSDKDTLTDYFTSESTKPELLVRDPEYYLDDPKADCFVRVEKTLFKVHQHVLETSEILAWKLARHLEEGPTSTECPFAFLYGTSADEFRALLWTQYTSSDKLENQPEDQSDLGRLLFLATITYRFRYNALHSWAITVINHAFTTKAVFADTCSSATFTRVVDVAVECKASDLLESVETKWSARVQRKDIPPVPAILAADRQDLRTLRGIAYYVYIQETMELQVTLTKSGATQLQVDPKLSNVQVMRLLSGHLSLVGFWERLRRQAPKLSCAEGCEPERHIEVCTTVWVDRWRAATNSRRVLGHHTTDVFAILLALREELGTDQELKRNVLPACRLAGLDTLKKVSDDLSETLPDHFFGCI